MEDLQGTGIAVAAKRHAFACYADRIQQLAAFDGSLDNSLVGYTTTASTTIIIIITAWETHAKLAICLGETLASAHGVAVLVARPGENRREVGDTLETPLAMRFVDGLVHGQTAEIKTDISPVMGVKVLRR